MGDDAPTTLFCPECAQAVTASRAAFAAPLHCPHCGKNGVFVDYARVTIKSLPIAKARSRSLAGPSRALCLVAILTGVLVLATAVTVWSGRASTAMWCGVIAAAVAVAMLTRLARLQSGLNRTQRARQRAERALTVSNATLESAAAINRGFQKNLANVVADERRRVQTKNAAQLAKIAEEREQVAWRVRRVEDQTRIVRALGDRILDDAMEQILNELTARNFDACRKRLAEVFAFCRDHEYPLSRQRQEDFLLKLAHCYNQELREEQERQQRDAVAARLRAEQQVSEEVVTEISRAESQRALLRQKLAEAQAANDTAESSSTTLKRLRNELLAVDQRAQDAASIQRNPRAGHVLVMSNVGSFGPGVLKICMSRRLDPQDAVRELSHAATPFPFDVHMVVSSERASELLHALHDSLHHTRINRVDLGRDFFRTEVDDVWRLVVALHGAVEYQQEPAAEEHAQSTAMNDEEFRKVTQVMHGVAGSVEVRFD